ncbi:hypothetical protein [Acutalibacter caecimuris]|nr:hypothetical protein [Acutalibacter sp. M00118]
MNRLEYQELRGAPAGKRQCPAGVWKVYQAVARRHGGGGFEGGLDSDL